MTGDDSVANPGSVDRYWVPADASYSLTPEGWLEDPESGWLYRPNSHAVRTRDLSNYACLVLLGEPGIGKSTSLDVIGPPTVPPSDSSEVLRIDLGGFSSEERLARRVFENDTVSRWRHGSGTLCLVLDSFDEAHSRVRNLHKMLGEYLNEWDCSRLFLRIACRTADWPVSLKSTLQDKFGDANVHELLPLRRIDAAVLLASAGIPAEQFLESVEVAHVVPLAARPLTLRLLVAATRQDGSLPRRAAELYERGLLTLADELNPGRRDARETGSSARNRLVVATRVAAISIFGDRPVIWTGPISQADSADLTVDDCLPTDLTGHPWSSDDVDATLRTGLFSGRGESRLGWSHATFAHYLASRWIASSDLNEAQIRSVLLSHDEKIPSRLRQVAAWLVASNPPKYGWLIQLDPEAFVLNIDIPDENLRRELVEALLAEARAGRLYYDYGWNLADLQHRTLGEQLRSALTESDHDVVRMTINIARQSRVTDLKPDLTRLALNARADGRLRVVAALAVNDLAGDNPSSDLVPLLKSPGLAPEDADVAEDLEAAAALASWPHAITTAEIFALINPRHPRNHRGVYSIFLSDFAERLASGDLDLACDWLMADIQRVDDSRLAPLVDAIVRLSIDHIGVPKARQLIKQVALRRADDYAPLFSRVSYTDKPTLTVEDRRAVALLLLEEANEDQILSIVYTTGVSHFFSGTGPGRFAPTDVFGWVAAGARLVGGCCRVGPADIAAMRAALAS